MKKLIVVLLTLSEPKNISHFTDFEQAKKINSCFAETFLQRRDSSTMWRLFYDVETFIAVYGVETFLQCGDFRYKELPTGLEFVSPKVSMLEVLCL